MANGALAGAAKSPSLHGDGDGPPYLSNLVTRTLGAHFWRSRGASATMYSRCCSNMRCRPSSTDSSKPSADAGGAKLDPLQSAAMPAHASFARWCCSNTWSCRMSAAPSRATDDECGDGHDARAGSREESASRTIATDTALPRRKLLLSSLCVVRDGACCWLGWCRTLGRLST